MNLNKASKVKLKRIFRKCFFSVLTHVYNSPFCGVFTCRLVRGGLELVRKFIRNYNTSH